MLNVHQVETTPSTRGPEGLLFDDEQINSAGAEALKLFALCPMLASVSLKTAPFGYLVRSARSGEQAAFKDDVQEYVFIDQENGPWAFDRVDFQRPNGDRELKGSIVWSNHHGEVVANVNVHLHQFESEAMETQLGLAYHFITKALSTAKGLVERGGEVTGLTLRELTREAMGEWTAHHHQLQADGVLESALEDTACRLPMVTQLVVDEQLRCLYTDTAGNFPEPYDLDGELLIDVGLSEAAAADAYRRGLINKVIRLKDIPKRQAHPEVSPRIESPQELPRPSEAELSELSAREPIPY